MSIENYNTKKIWNEHYTRNKSRLIYPDENLVRILSGLNIQRGDRALDFGAGSGRHSLLMMNYGFKVSAMDYASNSLRQIQELEPEIETILADGLELPFKEEAFSFLLNWGVLHYNSREDAKKLIKEFRRVTKKGSYIAGTLRANTETYLRVNEGLTEVKDLKGANVDLYSLEELKDLLSGFDDVKLAYMERSPIGKLEERICHWIYLVKN
ncbi:MAG: class I SAM-dependent methyltransferase [Leptospiraceae bacterium]|nr:class I SAM-dependent methyltransferase [Leptospiraceae bacterium]MCP5501507.1 class I SAM-dependent methyltransferase [Leptospiraceae bacterium]